jgi:LacI family transcriptional regulator
LVTIADVAKEAGVSMMTVSRVINHSGSVSEKTRRRVQDAIDLLNYRPNMLAKGLATGKSKLIAYVMSNLSDPFHSLVSKGIENACFDRNYTVIICDTGSDQRVEDCIDMLIDRQIDGAIFHHLNMTPEHVARLAAGSVQCVMIDNETELPDVSSVDSDNYLGGMMAAKHLIAKGHKNIGCITGYLNDPDSCEEYIDKFQRKIWRDRTEGYLGALSEAGLPRGVLYEGSGSLKQGFLLAQGHLREIMRLPDPPTALYCANDVIALGALSELLEMGIPVPGRMAVVGHDGLEMSMILYPRVTTIVQPRYEMGFTAANMLLDLIENQAEVEHRVMASALFQGDTT